MTEGTSASKTWVDGPEYMEAKQVEIMRIVQKSYKSGMISKNEYVQLLLKEPETSHDLEHWYAEIILSLAENKYQETLERIQKGAIYLEREDLSEVDRLKGVKLYDELCRAAKHYREVIQSVSDGGRPREEKTNQGSAADYLDKTGA